MYMTTSSMQSAFAGILTAILVSILYWNGLFGTFFFDDEANILIPEGIKLSEFTLHSVHNAMTSGIASPTGRPIAQLSFALNHYFSGFDPFAYKATNLVIHLVTGLLVYLVARRLLIAPSIAGFIALLWLVHPIQLTSVLYVVQRMTSLATLFLLAGFLLHMSGRNLGGRKGTLLLLLAWFLCWPLSFMSKEVGVLLPLFVLAWELIIRRCETAKLDRFAHFFVITIGFVISFGLVYLVLTKTQWLLDVYTTRSFSLTDRLLTESRVLWFYISLIIFPRLEAFALHHDDFALSTSLFSPWTTMPALIGWAGMAWLAWKTRLKAPLLSFGIAWFLIGHSLESTLLPLEIVHEHRNYLSSIGLVFIAAWTLARLSNYSDWRKTLAITLAAGMMISFSITTALRAHQFGDELRRTQIEAEYHPMSARAHLAAGNAIFNQLGISDDKSPRYYFTRRHYEKAGELEPSFKLGLLGLIKLECRVYNFVSDKWITELAKRLHKTTFASGDRNILYHINESSLAGSACLKRNHIELLFNAAISNTTATDLDKALMHSWQADYLTHVAQDLPSAHSELKKSLDILPNIASNLLKLSQLTYLMDDRDESQKILDRINLKSLQPSERESMALLMNCLGPNGTLNCPINSTTE